MTFSTTHGQIVRGDHRALLEAIGDYQLKRARVKLLV
jgi:hypothetical protein